MKLRHAAGIMVSMGLMTLVLAPVLSARPLPQALQAPPRYTDLSGSASSPGAPGVFGTASGPDTVYFGGTTWNSVAMRWEALRDSCWTFDSGVGSAFLPTPPFKDPSLHAVMEGWTGIDRTAFSLPYFRRLAKADFPGTGQSICAMTGDYIFWAGVLPAEANNLCYAAGQGYGNNWNLCIEKTFTYNGTGTVNFQYDYENDTELDFDYSYAYIDTSLSGNDIELAMYSGSLSGTELVVLTPGATLRTTAGPFKLKFCVVSDDSYSDEDGGYTTNCGALAIDQVSVNGGGIAYATGFELGEDSSWTLTPASPGQGGDWSDIVHVSDLPPTLVDCVCNLSDSVLVFEDPNYSGHNIFQNNFVASPWIDLAAAGVVGAPGKFIETDIYAYMPVLNYVYSQFLVQWYPETCTGGNNNSPWTLDGQTHFFGGIPTCTQAGADPFRTDLSGIIDVGAERVRIGVGVFSACLFFTNCTGLSNSTPWYDNIRFGVCGTLGGGGPVTPVLTARAIDLPQDAFPEDGSLSLTSPGRFDSGTVKGALQAEPYTSLGDTLVVQGGSGGAEVWVQFAVRPGPDMNLTNLNALLSTLTFQETKGGLDWYAARMDTAEQGGVPSPGSWMTAFHEQDPGFSGSDTDLDGGDLDPNGGSTRLANDIFPDDLFTAGTRVNMFYKTRFTGGTAWATLPDTTGGRSLEMEVLPSSIDSTEAFNCILYVDHSENPDTRTVIESALGSVVPGGSGNWESTAWDRYDVRAASSAQATFGRPGGSEYGATITQALGYKTILWDSGSLDAHVLMEEDAAVLRPWLLLAMPGSNRLYLAGDGLATAITAEAANEPMALDLLENVTGVQIECGTFRDQDCPTGSPQDATACVAIDPVGGAVVSLRPQGGTPRAQGNGCPINRSFDVLTPTPLPTNGAGWGEEEYNGSKTVTYASVANETFGPTLYRTMVDGLSLSHRRDPGTCQTLTLSSLAAAERLEEVLDWFGYSGAPGLCTDPGVPTAVGDDPGPGSALKVALAPFSPNPLGRRQAGRIQFTLRESGPAAIAIYDLNGRRVKSVFDGTAAGGVNEVAWNGTDEAGRPVANGVYFYTLRTPSTELARKLVVAGN